MLRICGALVAEKRAVDWSRTTCLEHVNRMAKDHGFQWQTINCLIGNIENELDWLIILCQVCCWWNMSNCLIERFESYSEVHWKQRNRYSMCFINVTVIGYVALLTTMNAVRQPRPPAGPSLGYQKRSTEPLLASALAKRNIHRLDTPLIWYWSD